MSVVRHLRPPSDTDAPDGRDELFRLIKDRSFLAAAEGEEFTLASGAKSRWYFNLKPTMMNARGNTLAARAFIDRLRGRAFDYIGGLEMGAVPIMGAVSALSEVDGHPIETLFVRKEKKGHGAKKLVEGLAPSESLDGKRVIAIDDVATKGGSILQAVEAVRAEGAVVDTALVLLDRDEGAAALLEAHGVRLESIFHKRDFV